MGIQNKILFFILFQIFKLSTIIISFNLTDFELCLIAFPNLLEQGVPKGNSYSKDKLVNATNFRIICLNCKTFLVSIKEHSTSKSTSHTSRRGDMNELAFTQARFDLYGHFLVGIFQKFLLFN